MDLGANEWTTFRKVTMPLIAPAVLASLLLCFAVSIDDFVVTYFNNGPRITFPLFVWGAANPVYNINQVSLRQAITPERMLGRMNASMRFFVWGTVPVGYLLE